MATSIEAGTAVRRAARRRRAGLVTAAVVVTLLATPTARAATEDEVVQPARVGTATVSVADHGAPAQVQTSSLYFRSVSPDRITVAAANDEPVLVADLVARKERSGPARLRGPIMFLHDGVVVSAKADGYWDPATWTFSGTYHGKHSVAGPEGANERTVVLSGHLDLLIPAG